MELPKMKIDGINYLVFIVHSIRLIALAPRLIISRKAKGVFRGKFYVKETLIYTLFEFRNSNLIN